MTNIEAEPATFDDDPRPVVALPRQGVPGALIAAAAVVAALLLFLLLDAQRRQDTRRTLYTPRASRDAFPPPPPLVIPSTPSPAPPVVTVETVPAPPTAAPPRPIPFAPISPAPAPVILQPVAPGPLAPTIERSEPRVAGPAIVYEQGQAATAGTPASSGEQQQGNRGGPGAQAGSNDAPARATLIGDKATVMPTGTVIPAVLETPIDTARPGLVRAVVSQDTRGFDGSRVLVSRGSRLIGEYQADARPGQNRVLVNWTRLIRPDGVAIRLGSPAADPLGGAGVPGRVNSFFFQRFAGAVLQSALQVGVNLASRAGSGSVIVGLPGTGSTLVGQSLLPSNDLRPKITVKQGAALNVFVARDLDFSGVPSRP